MNLSLAPSFRSLLLCNRVDRMIVKLLKSTDRGLDFERDDVGRGPSRPRFATAFTSFVFSSISNHSDDIIGSNASCVDDMHWAL